MELKTQHWQTGLLEDRTVVRRVLDGERDLFELLMRRYNQKMFRLARSYISDPAEAEDVLQEAYTRAYVALEQFRGHSFGAWMARIVVNEALSRYRRPRMQAVTDLPNVAATDTATPATEQLAGREQMLGLIESAIDRLPLEFRTVFVLRAVEQLSVEETAAYLDIKPATVKTRFHRARILLQEKLYRYLEEVGNDAFAFGGARCDRIVASVLERLNGM